MRRSISENIFKDLNIIVYCWGWCIIKWYSINKYHQYEINTIFFIDIVLYGFVDSEPWNQTILGKEGNFHTSGRGFIVNLIEMHINSIKSIIDD